MKLSLRQFLFFIGLFAILLPIVAILSYFVSKKPELEKETDAFFKASTLQNSRFFLGSLRRTCMLLNEDIELSGLSDAEKEIRREELKDHIVKYIDANRFGKNAYYWVVELVDDNTSVIRVSNSDLREGSVLEMTENMHLHMNFITLLNRAKNIKKINKQLGKIRAFNPDDNNFYIYVFVPELNWLVGMTFDMTKYKQEGVAFLDSYEDYNVDNLLYFSVVSAFLASVLIFFLVNFISTDFKVLQRVLEHLRRGNLTEAKYAFRMLSFDKGGAFLQLNVLEMEVLQYINSLYKTLKRTKTLSDKLIEISKHSTELIFVSEDTIKNQSLSVKQSVLQSDAIVLSSNSLNVTALNSSRELLEFLKSSESANESLNRLKVSILNLSKASRETSNILEFINNLTVKIKEVVLDINKVSENANLVSFNIAIEAEKVGVEGLALSLLSKEIHNVAVDTKVLTEKIELSAMDLQNTLSKDLGDMAKFSLKIQETNYSLSTLAGNLGEIVRGVDVLLKGFETLSSIISQQFEEAHNLSSSMITLNSSNEELSANISGFKAGNESLMQKARELQTRVSEFHF